MSSKFSNHEIESLASLAQIELAPQEVSSFSSQLEKIISAVEYLQTINTDGIEPLYNFSDGVQQLREDVCDNTSSQQAVTYYSKHAKNGYITVPKTI